MIVVLGVVIVEVPSRYTVGLHSRRMKDGDELEKIDAVALLGWLSDSMLKRLKKRGLNDTKNTIYGDNSIKKYVETSTVPVHLLQRGVVSTGLLFITRAASFDG